MNKNLKKEASRYVKIVEWSDEDNCFVGRCPELFHGGTHGDDEARVYADLCAIVEDVLESREAAEEAVPGPAFAKQYSGKFILRTGKDLHKALAIKAYRVGKSLNDVCLDILRGPQRGVQIGEVVRKVAKASRVASPLGRKGKASITAAKVLRDRKKPGSQTVKKQG